MVLSTQATRHHVTKSTSAIHAAAAKAEPKIRRAILRLLESAQRSVPDLEAMIRRGDIDAVWRAVKGANPAKATVDALVDAVASAGIQSGAAEAARFSIAFNQPAQEAIRFAALDAAKLGMHDMDKPLVRTILSRGVEQGHHPRVTAKHLKAITPILPRHQHAVDRYYQGIIDNGGTEAFARRMADRKATKLKKYRAKMIARTEASRSANMGQQKIWDQAIAADLLPADTKKKWVATPGACPICTGLDGKAVPVQGTFTTGSQSPPAHPHCLPGDALVSTRGGIAATTERIYVGDLVTVVTDQHRLRITPNHPILTPHGWVPAGSLNVGDDVIGGVFGDRIPVGDVYDQDVPARIEEVAETFAETRLVSTGPVPVTAEDFHGDGEGSEVAVVSTDLLLRDDGVATVGEPSTQPVLVGGGVSLPSGLDRRGGSVLAGLGDRGAPDRVVGGSGLRGSLCLAHALPLDRLSGRPATDRGAGFGQASSDDGAGDTEVVCESVLGFSGEVSTHKVVSVEVVAFHGPVLNLETSTGYYIADGLVVHNCRCTMVIDRIPTPERARPDTAPAASTTPRTLDAMRQSASNLPTAMRPVTTEAIDKAEAAITRHPDGARMRRRMDALDDTGTVNKSFQRRHPKTKTKAGEYAPKFDVDDPTTLKVYAEVSGRLESADDIASTFVHELTHAMDDKLGASRVRTASNNISTHGSQIGARVQGIAKDISNTIGHPYRETFRYASSSPHEALAEIVQFEITGRPARVFAGGQYVVPEITPAAFRREFPELSELARRWIRGDFDA